jgi:hypothetical protein
MGRRNRDDGDRDQALDLTRRKIRPSTPNITDAASVVTTDRTLPRPKAAI